MAPIEARRPNSLSDMNTKGSGIPMLVKNDRFERFLTISQSLNRKSSINGLSGEMLPSAHQLEESKQANSRALLHKLEQEAKSLDKELSEATRRLAYAQEEAFETRKLHRALQNEYSTLQSAVEEHEGKFEFLSGQVTTRVEMMERDIQLQIKEYGNKAQSSYNDVEMEVKTELQNALRSEDEETSKELAVLEEKKKQLELQLGAMVSANNDKIKKEQDAISRKADEAARNIDHDVSIAEQTLCDLQKAHDALEEENQKLQAAISSEEAAGSKTKSEISALEHIIQNHVVSRSAMEAKLRSETERLRAFEETQQSWQQKEAEAKLAYEKERSKHDAYMSTRRRLEHAISRLSGKSRALIRIKHNLETGVDHAQATSSKYGTFKVSAYEPDADFSRNWELLSQECLRGARVSLSFFGLPRQDMCSQLADILVFLQRGQASSNKGGQEHTFCLQSVLIHDNNRYSDLLNSSSEVDIQLKTGYINVVSQKMLVSNSSEIHNTLKSSAEYTGAYLHVFTVMGSGTGNSETPLGSVSILDLSHLSWQAQNEALAAERNTGILHDLLQRSPLDHNNMDICDLDNADEPGAQELLASLESRAC
nr:hypothetical protein [Metschnikowia bicuspidata]